MGETSAIEWTDATWNPIRGCTRVSEGCRHCYAETLAARFSLPGQWGEGLATRTSKGARWTGKIDVAPDATFLAPLRWKKPKRIFVNSLSDLFHEAVPDAVIDRVFAVMALSPQHTFQLLTKRPERMRDYMASLDRAVVRAYTPPHQTPSLEDHHAMFFACIAPKPLAVWPLPNVWLGVSVEDQAAADARIPLLLATPAAKRFLSCEPLLGPVDWFTVAGSLARNGGIDWVIAGGESGPGARPMHPDWARDLRDQCAAADVPFFFKQWGEWMPVGYFDSWGDSFDFRFLDGSGRTVGEVNGRWSDAGKVNGQQFARCGKKRAGNLLDGRQHLEWPE